MVISIRRAETKKIKMTEKEAINLIKKAIPASDKPQNG